MTNVRDLPHIVVLTTVALSLVARRHREGADWCEAQLRLVAHVSEKMSGQEKSDHLEAVGQRVSVHPLPLVVGVFVFNPIVGVFTHLVRFARPRCSLYYSMC